MSENKHTKEDLKEMQSWSLEQKIRVTQTRILEWYLHYNGQVYVSFSGGKDSTVLLDLVRKQFPEVEAVFVDTGLEYPEIKNFVKTVDNCTVLRPNMSFKEVIEKYGYPLISKEVSRDISVARNKPGGKTAQKFIRGSEYHEKYGDRFLLEKWNYLKDSDILISNKCCNIMKKNPLHQYNKETNKHPIIGTLASESQLRKKEWLNNGCNAFDTANPSSQPLSFWTEQDVLEYIQRAKLPYCKKIYGNIIEENGKLKMSNIQRTGCMFCMFGVHLEKEPNRVQQMAITHPKIHDYCIRDVEDGGLGLGKVLDYIGVNYKPIEEKEN